MLPTKFRFIWPTSFRGEELLNIDQSETRIACGSYVSSRIGTKRAIFIKNLPRMLSTKFQFIWTRSFREAFLENNQPEITTACGGHVC
jgi:hypothetical protein